MQEPTPLRAKPAVDGPASSDEWETESETRECVVGSEAHRQRLDKVLADLLPAFSRSYLKGLIEDGFVQAQDASQPSRKPAMLVNAGQRFRVHLQPTESSLAYVPQDMPLNLVYEDNDLRVIDKPVGLVVHPAPGHWSGTLLNGLLAHDPKAAHVPRAGIVHRLDKDTSGLMVVARHRQAMDALVDAIAARQVQRQYLAISQRPWQGTLEREVSLPIGRDPQQRLRMVVVDLRLHAGKPAQTLFRCLQSNEHGALVHATLQTGRTHQIRVHMASLGHPLVGDRLYGGARHDLIDRQALHAFHLSFNQPMTGKALRFESPLPADMQSLLTAWGLKNPLG